MDPSDLETFRQAIALAQTYQQPKAYSLLKTLAHKYPSEPSILLWLVYTTSDIEEAEGLIKSLQQNYPTYP